MVGNFKRLVGLKGWSGTITIVIWTEELLGSVHSKKVFLDQATSDVGLSWRGVHIRGGSTGRVDDFRT